MIENPHDHRLLVYEPNRSPMAAAIIKRLAERNMRLSDLADAIGKKNSYVSAILHGRFSLSPDIAVLIADAMDMNPEEILILQVREQIRKVREKEQDVTT